MRSGAKRDLVHFMGPARADIIGTSAFISSRSQKVEEDYRKDAYNASYAIRLKRSQPRHPAVTPYPGSQKALAFVTIPDNAAGVSGMTRRSHQPDSVLARRRRKTEEPPSAFGKAVLRNLNGESSRAMRKLIIPISIVLVALAFLNAVLGLYAGETASALAALVIFAAAILLLIAVLARPKTEGIRPAAKTVSPSPPTLSPHQSNAEVVNFLAILQEKGRLVDFLMDDIKGYSDAEVGAAARVLHEGCKAVLLEHFGIRPVRAETEGSKVTVPAGYAPDEYRLVGKIRGQAPFSGVLVHHGWRTEWVKLPRLLRTGDDRLPTIAPSEIELK